MSVAGGGGHLSVDRYISHLFLSIFTEGDFNTSFKWGQVYPDTKVCICPLTRFWIALIALQMDSSTLTQFLLCNS